MLPLLLGSPSIFLNAAVEDLHQVAGDEESFLHELDRRGRELAEVVVRAVIERRQLRFRPCDKRADEAGAVVGKAAAWIAQVPAGERGDRDLQLGEADAGELVAVGAD